MAECGFVRFAWTCAADDPKDQRRAR